MKASYNDGNNVILKNVASDENGKLQTTDTDLNSKITASNTNLININTSVVQKSDLINSSIVATNGKLDGIKGVLEAEKTVLDNTLNAINNNVLRATFNGFSRNVACDDNGVLKSNIVVENIALSPSTDGVTIYGTTNGINRTSIVTDLFGKLQTTDTDLNSKITTTNTNLTNINGLVVITNTSLSNILTETLGVKNVITQTTNGHLIDIKTIIEAVRVLTVTINTNINSIAINNNLDVSIRRLINFTTDGTRTFPGSHSFPSIDLGTGANRYRSVTYAGSLFIPPNQSQLPNLPELIIQLSSDNINFYSDGTVCSFYKQISSLWQFVFQRSDISMRYCRLHLVHQTSIENLYETISKN